MVEPRKLFCNFFSDERITPMRLNNFAEDVLASLERANVNGEYISLINLLMFAVDEFYNGLYSAIAPNNNKAEIPSPHEIAHAFRDCMAEMQYYIADAVGSFKSPAYKSFYPKGLSEYTTTTKIQAYFLMKRVSTLAETQKHWLGYQLSERLSSFEKQWQKVIHSFLINKTTYRIPERRNLELTLLTVIHAIAQKFPGNLFVCMSFFNFSLLYDVDEAKL